MAATYDIGDRIRITASFVNSAGAATNPTAVAVTVRKPDGSTTAPSASSDVVGTWYADVDPDQHGNWFYRFAGTGALVVAEESQFYVRPRRA